MSSKEKEVTFLFEEGKALAKKLGRVPTLSMKTMLDHLKRDNADDFLKEVIRLSMQCNRMISEQLLPNRIEDKLHYYAFVSGLTHSK